MILNLTDAEALALSQSLMGGVGRINNDGLIDTSTGPIQEEGSAIDILSLDSAKSKLKIAMQKSDAKMRRSLGYVISSLEGSGFDSQMVSELKSASDKIVLHNDKKYQDKDEAASKQRSAKL